MASAKQIESQVRQWLEANWDPTMTLKAWRRRLLDGGWAAPIWPEDQGGRGYTVAEGAVVANTFRAFGAVGAASSGPGKLAAETILVHGNAEQKARFLPPILTGEQSWCQLFSEPGSGSDLAGATTRAERDEAGYCINGQKVWNTSAHHADWGILVARTDWDLPKHQGLSFFLINMHQPGVEVRPLKQMNGYASFNEVFLTDARVAEADRLGAEGEGWRIAMTTLSVERQGFTNRRGGPDFKDRSEPIYAEYRAEQRRANEPYVWYPQRAGRADLALERAAERGKLNDPAVRQALSKLLMLEQAGALAAQSVEAARRAGSNETIPAGSIGKLTASRVARQAAAVHTLISGTDAMLAGTDAERDGLIAEVLLSVPAISIAGGTDEIQKNIIAERVLGMPKEPRFDGGPFRDVPRNSSG